MPLMHSEELAVQEAALPLFEQFTDARTAEFARRHRDVIARFRRFPPPQCGPGAGVERGGTGLSADPGLAVLSCGSALGREWTLPLGLADRPALLALLAPELDGLLAGELSAAA